MGRRKQTMSVSVVHPNAGGLDIGKDEIFAAVPPERDPEPVRAFATFTADLGALGDWLVASKVDTVAMESTGVYWIPIYELLEARGIRCFLVNAASIKRVPGRKSDSQDCQWLQTCHSLGLLAASFRPDEEMVRLRTYLRHRAELLSHRAPHILHMQRVLHLMNIQLDGVLTDITGVTGLAILRAIVAGERDPVKLAQYRQPTCHSSEDAIAKALTGQYRDDYLFALGQSLQLYDFYTAKVAECDAEIERYFSALRPRFEATEDEGPSAPPTTSVKGRSKSKNQPAGQSRQHIYRITGVDLVAVPGISASLAQTIVSEIGTDMSKWPTVKQFASWLRLSPANDISGGRVLRSRTLPTKNRAAQAFRMAAQSVIKADCALGAFYRRLRARIGPAQALVATAHKIARIVYHMLRDRRQYVDVGAETYSEQIKAQKVRHLQRQAARLGYTLQPQSAT